MATNLVIVESPAKASTIKGYLGTGYKVVASKGHVKDLPKSTLGVDIENGFQAKYINIRGKGELIAALKKETKAADKIFLATDPDREGEAISWHLASTIGADPKKTKRVTFNEITKTAIKAAIKNPRDIDMNLVNAQQSRRILDRIVGYKLSPFLWRTVKSGLSAGRVQSVATRIIVERENEIRAFTPKEYWTIAADLETPGKKSFTARFYGVGAEKTEIADEAAAEKIVSYAKAHDFIVASVKKTVKYKTPAPPFITSTLQQEASRRLNFQSQRTMRVAQELYEGVNLGAEFGGTQGIITYMRTDSLRISAEAQDAVRELIAEKYGENYLPAAPRIYKTKAGAQDAHEAIRPSSIRFEPEKIRRCLTSDQYRLYKLIWDRFVASQMQSAELDTVAADIKNGDHLYRSSGYTVRFKGYMAVYEESTDEENADEEKGVRLPPMEKGDMLSLEAITPTQHYTEPPARFTEATLIKFLEEMGIGRPSTYTPIITTIISRDYVKRSGKSLCPTNLGEVTTRLMTEYFPDIVDYKFTAEMEEGLDEIEHGKATMQSLLSDFWQDFSKDLEKAEKTMENVTVELQPEKTDIICEKCGATMIVKNGRYGKFAACPNYPTCKNTKPLGKDGTSEKEAAEKKAPKAEKTDMVCELCGGAMLLRQGKYGAFYACENFPKCKNTKPFLHETGRLCPKCGGKILLKHGKRRTVFYSCEHYPDCDFSTWDTPTDKACPQCGKMLLKKKGKNQLICSDKNCSYKETTPEAETAEA